MSVLTYFWTSATLVIGAFACVQSASLRFYHGSLHNYTVTTLDEPLRILPYFDRRLTSMFYVFGFSNDATSPGTISILSAYLNTKNANVILLDWSDEARIEQLGELLTYIFKSVPNCQLVGIKFGRALVTLMENGLFGDSIHLVGHSLGAHVSGYAGEYTRNNNHYIGRITGLDPAGPLFEGLIKVDGLNSSHAKFVDVLHTDPGLYGIKESIGNVDFWANCDKRQQPECPNLMSEIDSFCSHHRSYEIFAEAVTSPTAFPAIKSENCSTWQHQKGFSPVIFLGDFVDTRAQGNYYFSTIGQYPFSKGRDGLRPNY